MQKVINKLNQIVDELNNKGITNKEEIDFFKTKIKTSKGITLSALDKYKNSDFLLANIRVLVPDKEFSEIKKLIAPISSELDEANIDLLTEAFQFLDDLGQEKIKKLLEKGTIHSKFLHKMKKEKLVEYTVNVDPLFYDRYKFEKLVILFEEFSELPVFMNLINLDNCLPLLEDNLINVIQKFSNTGKFVSRENTKNAKKLEKELDMLYTLKALAEENVLAAAIESVDEISDVLKQFSEYVAILEKQEKEEKKSNNKKVNLYRELIIKIKNNKKITFDDIDFIEDESLKTEVILCVLEKNKLCYNALLEEFEQNKKADIDELDKILLNYNILINNSNNKMLLTKNINLDDIEKMLMELNEEYFDFVKQDEVLLVKILLFSCSKNINKIKFWLKQEYITMGFLKANIDILISNDFKSNEKLLNLYKNFEVNPLFKRINNNIELFFKNNICIENIKKYNINFLLKDTNEITEVFDILNKYELDFSSTNLIDFTFIEDSKKLNVVDLFIEIGMFDYLKEHIELINKNPNIIKKILLLKQIDYPICDENNVLLNIIKEDNKFYVSDDDLDNYLTNETSNHMNLECYFALEENKNNKIDSIVCYGQLMMLIEKNCKVDDNRYNFNGITISRNKVLRNMTTLKQINFAEEISETELVINSILYNSILDEQSISIIISNIDDMLKNINKQLKK